MEVVSGDNWCCKTCKVPVKASPNKPTSNIFYRPKAGPSSQRLARQGPGGCQRPTAIYAVEIWDRQGSRSGATVHSDYTTMMMMDTLPVWPTVSEHWKETVSYSTDLLSPCSPGGLPSLSWSLTVARVAKPLVSTDVLSKVTALRRMHPSDFCNATPTRYWEIFKPNHGYAMRGIVSF